VTSPAPSATNMTVDWKRLCADYLSTSRKSASRFSYLRIDQPHAVVGLVDVTPDFEHIKPAVTAARIVSGVVTLMLLIGLGVGRAHVARRDILRTVLETVAIGNAAALAGVGISVFIDRAFGG
jgi:hypothetical protein